MYTENLNDEQKRFLFKALRFISEVDGNTDFAEVEMILVLKSFYDIEEIEVNFIDKENLYEEFNNFTEKERADLLAHIILLVLVDGHFAEEEKEIINKLLKTVSLDNLVALQKIIEEYGKISIDLKDILINIHNQNEVITTNNIETSESIEIFNKFSNQSADNLDDSSIFEMKKGPVKKVWAKVLSLWEVVKNPNVGKAQKAIAIGALIYLITPIDAVPDILPAVGLTDDVGIITFAVTQLASLIEK